VRDPSSDAAPEVAWLTAFVDVAAERWDAALAFWPAVTGTTLSPVRGPDGRFATLLPADGDPHVRLQRLDDGPAGVHLDLHTADRPALEQRALDLGARLRERLDDVTVMTSPGGFAFCLVAPHESVPSPAPLLDQVCLDIPSTALEREVAFWSELLGQRVLPAGGYAEFTDLERAEHLPLRLLLQEVGGAGPVTGHLDLAGAPDRRGVVARLEALGAERIDDLRHWTTMRAPDGRVFCVTDRHPGEP
jgi:hypothetical protein